MAVISALPRADWLIAAAAAIVVLLSRLYAHRHPKVPPKR